MNTNFLSFLIRLGQEIEPRSTDYEQDSNHLFFKIGWKLRIVVL